MIHTSDTLIVKAIDLGDEPGFMITSQEDNPAFLADLEREKRNGSTISLPLSAKLPIKMELVYGGKLLILESSKRSRTAHEYLRF